MWNMRNFDLLLIPGSLGINQNGACLIDAGAKLTILGSVIIDCEDKHYNTVGGKGAPER
jgi:hypothetical protein